MLGHPSQVNYYRNINNVFHSLIPLVLHQPARHLHPAASGGHPGSSRREEGEARPDALTSLSVSGSFGGTELCANCPFVGEGLDEGASGEVPPTFIARRESEGRPGEIAA